MGQASERWQVDGRTLTITHPDKLEWPDDGLTKRDLLDYYRQMAPVMLPVFARRPVTLRVFPRGIAGPSFYRRELPNGAPPWLGAAEYVTETNPHRLRLPLVQDAAGLLWLANTGAIEFHLWASRADHLREPDWAIFDLDPGPRASFGRVLEAALLVRERAEAQGLGGYPKTSGGRGLHIYAPLAPGQGYDAVRARVKEISDGLAADHPELFAPAHGKTHRGDRIAVDYAQNSVGHNTAAPYTIRARPGAPVSTPLSWEEVEAGEVRPESFTLREVPTRVRRLGDLFAPARAFFGGP